MTTLSKQLRDGNRKSKKVRETFISQHLGSNVAAQLFSMRNAKGWTQQQLADAIGTVQTRIPVLENPDYQNYSVQTLLKIAAAFDVGLVVRFVPFKEVEDWAAGHTAYELVPPSFDEEEILLTAATESAAMTSNNYIGLDTGSLVTVSGELTRVLHPMNNMPTPFVPYVERQ